MGSVYLYLCMHVYIGRITRCLGKITVYETGRKSGIASLYDLFHVVLHDKGQEALVECVQEPMGDSRDNSTGGEYS
jgi:hypothetical protein